MQHEQSLLAKLAGEPGETFLEFSSLALNTSLMADVGEAMHALTCSLETSCQTSPWSEW